MTDAQVFKSEDPLHTGTVDVQGGVVCFLLPEIENNFDHLCDVLVQVV